MHDLNRFFVGLAKKCKHREEDNYSYGKLVKISDVPGIQPAGYLVRIPFYVLAPRDAHIVFSPTESPNWTSENVYEVVIGGFGVGSHKQKWMTFINIRSGYVIFDRKEQQNIDSP